MKMVYFDITNVAGLGDWQQKKSLIAQRARELASIASSSAPTATSAAA